MKKISVIGVTGIPASYGGFESLVENLTFYSSEDIYYRVFCSSYHYTSKISIHNNAELIYLPLKANGLQSIIYDALSLFISIFKKNDAVLILGVSGCVFLPLFKFFSPKCKIITNIDGLEWKREKWGKMARYFLKFSESLAVKYSDEIITDNQGIADYVREEYKVRSSVIAYGGDHALLVDIIDKEKNNENFFLTVCRIEPENNVHLILDAFSKSNEKIKFIGNWNASEYGRDLIHKYKNCPQIELMHPVYDIRVLFKLRTECKGYVHGHSAGGTNPSLVEAMHFGKDIFAFDCNFNRFTTQDEAYYFKNSQELLALISKKILIGKGNGAAMKQIANQRYTWEIITRQYEALY